MSPETIESLTALLVTLAVAAFAVRSLVHTYRSQRDYERGRFSDTVPAHGHAHSPVPLSALPPVPGYAPSVGAEAEEKAA